MFQPQDYVRHARNLMTPKGAWLQGKLAMDREGKTTTAIDPAAIAFCAIGAVERVTWGNAKSFGDVVKLLNEHIPEDFRPDFTERDWMVRGTVRVVLYNNGTDQATVLAWFDRAAHA